MTKLPSILDTEDSLLLPDGSIIALNSKKFLGWLEINQSFRFDCGLAGKDGFTARKEKSGYWYAYKRILGKLHKSYIGPSIEITIPKLLEVAKKLQEPPSNIKNQLPKKLHSQVTEVTEVTQVTLIEMQQAIEALTRRVEQLEAVSPIEEVDSYTAKLEKRIQEFTEQNYSLMVENERLNNELAKVHDDLAALHTRHVEAVTEVAELTRQINSQPLASGQTITPALIDEFLTELKLGKQSPDYKAAKKWLNKFINFHKT